MSDRWSSVSGSPPPESSGPGFRLRPGTERATEGNLLAESVSATGGGRVGLPGLMDDLNRSASVVRVPAPAVHWGFRWDDDDMRSRRWWTQGITTSADHDEGGLYGRRPVVMCSWYSKELDGLHMGSRVSVVDLDLMRYRHVLLVDVLTRPDGSVGVRPLRVHAGGIVWHGDHLYVAATARGICVFRLDDLVRVGDRDRTAVTAGTFGYRYLLPVRFTYDSAVDDGHEPMRYSFISLSRNGAQTRLVAGEYGRAGRSTRLAAFPVDAGRRGLELGADGAARPATSAHGVEGMQGATVVDGRWYVTTSAGRWLRGSLHVGEAGRFHRHARVLPVGVEDLAYWHGRDELWSLSEYPGRRYVFAMSRPGLR